MAWLASTPAACRHRSPFGGIKQPGIGREGSRHGLEDYLEWMANWTPRVVASVQPAMSPFDKGFAYDAGARTDDIGRMARRNSSMIQAISRSPVPTLGTGTLAPRPIRPRPLEARS